MSNTAYIADNNDQNKIYLDLDPSPVPFLRYEPGGARRRTLNSRDSQGNMMQGAWHHYLGGCHLSGAVIEAWAGKIARGTYEGIISKLTGSGMGRVVFSPDNGITRYACVFSPDTPSPEAIDGTEFLRWKIRLNVVGLL